MSSLVEGDMRARDVSMKKGALDRTLPPLSAAAVREILAARGIEVSDEIIDQLTPMVGDVLGQARAVRVYVEERTPAKR